ncbi:ACRO protein, partial [Herpetotheres cachinnans]|nr:ACRO protein [Herpetotheres cachinnans]
MAFCYGMLCAVGGTDAQPGAWPWIFSIQDPWKIDTGHICRGCLISPQWVLTAAHCFIELTQLGPEAQVRTKWLLVHEHYSSITERNNIALLELDQPVQYNDYVQLACVFDASLSVRA